MIDYDKICVMDKGKVVEYENPYLLFKLKQKNTTRGGIFQIALLFILIVILG